jgi:transcriptional regulator with XRE-family HTH domain
MTRIANHREGSVGRSRSKKPQTPFAKRLERVRLSFGMMTGRPELSAKEFAGILGFEAATYRQYERGVAMPTIRTLAKIRQITNVGLDWLVCGDGPRHMPIKGEVGAED